MRDNADLAVDTSERGIAISEIYALQRETLLEIAVAAYGAGLLTTRYKPTKMFQEIAQTAFFTREAIAKRGASTGDKP